MRFVVELEHTTEGVTGVLTREADPTPRRFSSWLELLAQLEQPIGTSVAARTDVQGLAELNHRIGDAETEGDMNTLGRVVAPVLAFRRASGRFVDRETFLTAVQPGPRRSTTDIHVVSSGPEFAVVRCVVAVDDGRAYDNIRLFVRSERGPWMLLGWTSAPAQ